MDDQATELSRSLRKAVGSFQCLADCTQLILHRVELIRSENAQLEESYEP